jgi:hypothetical protein
MGATYDTVIRMIQPYQDQQLILFTDSWFTSPTLLNALQERGIRMCGSVRSNRKGLPRIDPKAVKSLKQGEWIQHQKGDMIFTVWKDQHIMKLLYNHVSPWSSASLQRWNDEGERICIGCPQAIHDYFYHARSVDVINQLHYNYLIGRKARRCWPRLAWWLLDMCIINAFKLWSMGQGKVSQLDFREQLMHELMKQLPENQKPHQARRGAGQFIASPAEHYPEHAEWERDCVECSSRCEKRVRTRLICHQCQKHLCPGECYRHYHVKLGL